MLLEAGPEARRRVRAGHHRGPTAALAPGYVQANLVILPQAEAFDFLRYCVANPKPCPVLAVSEPGDWRLPALGADLDVRTDVPGFQLFRDGVPVGEADDLNALWADDLVAFALGCSFSFEQALVEHGIPVRHVARGMNVAMYVSNIQTRAAGRYGGPMVVSMRPMPPAEALRAVRVTSRFPSVHGAPLHVGDPAAIGITDLSRPDFGEFTPPEPGDIPVFWACGVTPQMAIRQARPYRSITHKPGHMLVTDLRNTDLEA